MFKTLIVEDNPDFRRSLGDLLREKYPAMQVAQAENIGQAWHKIFDIEPNLVFVDIKLQEENGLDLVQMIRESHSDILVAIITSSNFPEYRDAAYQYGAHYFIPKNIATSSDILILIDSIQDGRPPQWSLGSEFINPSSHNHSWKK